MQAAIRKTPIRRLLAVLMTLLALGILAGMIYTNREDLLAVCWKLRPPLLVGSFLAYAVCVMVASLNWGHMMRTFGSQASWRQHITIYAMSLLMSRLPLPLGYVAGRLLFYEQDTSKVIISFASALELTLILFTAAGLSLVFWPHPANSLDWRIAAPVLILGLAAVHPRLLNRLLAWLRVDTAHQLRYAHTTLWLGVSVLVWLLAGSTLYLMIASIYPLPVNKLALVIGAWCLSNLATTLMIFLPVGLGLRELAFGALLSFFLPPGVSALAAILSRVMFTLYELILAAVASVFRTRRDKHA